MSGFINKIFHEMRCVMRKIVLSLIILIMWVGTSFAGAPLPGENAPEFSLKSMDGNTFSLSEFKGKVVLIGMFHICVPCMNQAMEFNKVRDLFGDDQLIILGINTNGDSKEAVAKYLSNFPEKVKFPYLIDPGKGMVKSYMQRDMPTVLIVDQKGVLTARASAVSAKQLIPYLKKMY
jgi:cytochrome c biogenesis protein CcmG, thiol:disulfide interchange protein DsbE